MTKYFYAGFANGNRVRLGKRIPITTSIPDAALLALSEQGSVYEVRPIGKVVADEEGEPGVHFLAKKAKVVRVVPWGEVRAYIKFRIMDEQQAENQEAPVSDESALPGSG